RFLTVLQLGDVAVNAEQSAVLQWLEREFEIFAARGALLVAAAARALDQRDALPHGALDVLGRAELAALGEDADHLMAGNAGLELVRRIAPHLDAEAVAEAPQKTLVPQRDAVAHVVEHGLHHGRRTLPVVAGA